MKTLNNTTRSQYLDAMGITQWVRRESRVQEEYTPSLHENITLEIDVGKTNKVLANATTQEQGKERWRILQARVTQCIDCDLHQSRKQTVFGVGNKNANWLIVGEAPGVEEDRQGEPFVGPAGKLLTNMLAALGLNRKDVYIANILKCRPPNNRDPRPDEVNCCNQYLQQQMDLVQPKIILAVGRIAAQNLLNTKETIGRLRGKQFEYGAGKIPLLATYHPAYLLRSPKEKSKAWQDLLLAQSVMEKNQ